MLELTGVIDATRQRLREVDREALRPMLLNYLTEIGVERAIRADEPNPNVAEIRWKMVSELVEGIARADEPESASAYAVLDRYVQSVTLDLTLIAQEREEENRNNNNPTNRNNNIGFQSVLPPAQPGCRMAAGLTRRPSCPRPVFRRSKYATQSCPVPVGWGSRSKTPRGFFPF